MDKSIYLKVDKTINFWHFIAAWTLGAVFLLLYTYLLLNNSRQIDQRFLLSSCEWNKLEEMNKTGPIRLEKFKGDLYYISDETYTTLCLKKLNKDHAAIVTIYKDSRESHADIETFGDDNFSDGHIYKDIQLFFDH